MTCGYDRLAYMSKHKIGNTAVPSCTPLVHPFLQDPWSKMFIKPHAEIPDGKGGLGGEYKSTFFPKTWPKHPRIL